MFNRLPKATKILLWINGGMFFLQLLVGNGLAPLMLWPIGGPDLIGNPISSALGNFVPWQLVTYAFLHDTHNFGHIFFNMLALLMFGAPLEYQWGLKRFLAFYFISVVGAGLTYLAWSAVMGYDVPVLGASGGVFGLLLAYGMLFPRQRMMLILPPVEIEARTLVIIYGVLQLYMGLTGTGGGTANFAHLGGMLFGWLVIRYWRRQPPFWRRKRRPPPPPPPPKFRVVR